MPKYRRGRGSVYRKRGWCYISYWTQGTRVTEATGTKDLTEAKRLLDVRRGELAEGRVVGPIADRVTFEELMEGLVNDYKINGKKTLPDVMVTSLDGKSVNIKDFAMNKKITVLIFWASWCSPCIRELDAISEVYAEWQEEYNVELVAIAIDTRRSLAKVRPMVEFKGWEYTILTDVKQDLKNALNFQALSQTYLLDQDGYIVDEHSGYVPGDEYELEAKIKELAEK